LRVFAISVNLTLSGNLEKEIFYKKVASFVKKLLNKKAELIVFPEYFSLDIWPLKSGKSESEITKSIANPLDKSFLPFLQELAIKHKLLDIGGTYPRWVKKQNL
jgi:predicted amidohydrolase